MLWAFLAFTAGFVLVFVLIDGCRLSARFCDLFQWYEERVGAFRIWLRMFFVTNQKRRIEPGYFILPLGSEPTVKTTFRHRLKVVDMKLRLLAGMRQTALFAPVAGPPINLALNIDRRAHAVAEKTVNARSFCNKSISAISTKFSASRRSVVVPLSQFIQPKLQTCRPSKLTEIARSNAQIVLHKFGDHQPRQILVLSFRGGRHRSNETLKGNSIGGYRGDTSAAEGKGENS